MVKTCSIGHLPSVFLEHTFITFMVTAISVCHFHSWVPQILWSALYVSLNKLIFFKWKKSLNRELDLSSVREKPICPHEMESMKVDAVRTKQCHKSLGKYYCLPNALILRFVSSLWKKREMIVREVLSQISIKKQTNKTGVVFLKNSVGVEENWKENVNSSFFLRVYWFSMPLQ